MRKPSGSIVGALSCTTVLMFIGAFAGCAGETRNSAMKCATGCPGAELELGTGIDRFEPTKDGVSTSLYRGPQGGIMVFLAVRTRGIQPDDVRLCYHGETLTPSVTISEGCWRFNLDPGGEAGRFQRTAVWGQLATEYWSAPEPLFDKDARFNVTVTDACGCTANDARTMHIERGVRE